ncbi:hypothetical protein [Paucihalobacter sp.]|uniref:hypothetical protein n=1 Tax=Paucihalobacter sp. TaxID=2850405 RepID=UPI003D160EE2
MRKLSLFVLLFTLFAASSTVTAQNKVEVNAAAAEQTEELRKQLKFSDEQRDQVYEICKEYQAAYRTLSVDLQANKEWKAKIDARLENKLATTLTEEQFNHYKKIQQSIE